MYKKHLKYTTTSPPTSCEKNVCKNEGTYEKAPKGTCRDTDDCKSSETCKDKKCVPKSNNGKMVITISIIVALLILGGSLYFIWSIQSV